MLEKRLDREQTETAISFTAATQEINATHPPPQHQPEDVVTGEVCSTDMPPLATLHEFDVAAIMELLADRTKLQAAELLERELGKWGIVEGPLQDITKLGSGGAMCALLAPNHRLIFCVFTELAPELRAVSRGDVMKVAGRIDEVERTQLTLSDCRLISHRPA